MEISYLSVLGRGLQVLTYEILNQAIHLIRCFIERMLHLNFLNILYREKTVYKIHREGPQEELLKNKGVQT